MEQSWGNHGLWAFYELPSITGVCFRVVFLAIDRRGDLPPDIDRCCVCVSGSLRQVFISPELTAPD